MSHRYQGFGLTLQSDFALPGASPDHTAMAADVVIRRVTALDGQDPGAHAMLGPYRLRAEALWFTQPGVGVYRCALSGDSLDVLPEPGVADGELAAYLEATALPALLWLRGDLVLHAAAAALPGSGDAVALLGTSGVGKSTLLRALLAALAGAVADDAAVPRAVPGAAGYRLYGLPAFTQERGPDAVRRRVAVPLDRQVRSARLGAVVELVPDGPSEPATLRGTEALGALLRHRHRARVPRLLGTEPRLLPHMADLTRHVPVWRWDAATALRLAPDRLLAALAGTVRG